MKFSNAFGTEHINVLPVKMFDDTRYVGSTHAAGSLTFF